MLNKRLIRFLEGARKYVVFTVLCQWLALFANIAMMYAISRVLGSVMEGSITNGMVLQSAAVIGLGVLLRNLFHMLEVRCSARASSFVKLTLRDRLYAKLLKIGMAYQEKISTSETVQVAVEGIEQLEIYFGKYLPQFFYSMLAPLTLFSILVFINSKVALILLGCVPLIPVIIIVIQKIARRTTGKYWRSYASLGEIFLENLQGLTTLKVYRADKRKAREMDREAEVFRKATMKVLSMQLNSIAVMDLVAYGATAAGIIFSLLELKGGRLSVSEAFLIILLTPEFFLPLRLLGSFFHIAMNGMAASDKLFTILDMEEEEERAWYGLGNIRSVEAEQLEFSYDGQRRILEDIRFRMEKKQLTALVGASGCGKSTIAALLTRRLKGYGGSIKIDGRELSFVGEEELLHVITLVSHNSYLFQGTVEDNLRMGNPEASREEMEQVLKDVDLYEWLSGLGGLSFKITEKASNLSGGQAQRLSLARALLHDSEIYIFDEVTSNIDAQSEKQIMSVIYGLAKEKTVLLISHRLLNVVDAHCIYVMDRGRIVQKGRHEEILGQEGIYRRLFENQKELETYAGDIA